MLRSQVRVASSAMADDATPQTPASSARVEDATPTTDPEQTDALLTGKDYKKWLPKMLTNHSSSPKRMN